MEMKLNQENLTQICAELILMSFSTADILAIALVAVSVTVTDAVKGNLTVTIKQADLPGNKKWFFKPDPYVEVTAIGIKGKKTLLTKIIHNNYDPVWNQVLDFQYGNWVQLKISVHDHDHLSADDILIPVFTRYIVK